MAAHAITRNTVSIVLSERAQLLFKLLVDRYIVDGQPVGSRTLARDSKLDLSPATVRNVMADLEDLGLIRSPHTSAGRVPTVQGYRLFVDTMMAIRELSSSDVERISQDLSGEENVPKLMTKTSSMLSEITRLASIVMIPRTEQQALRQVEFLPLSDNRVLAILVVNEKEVQNRIIHTARQYSATDLEQAATYLNQAFAGKDVAQVREDLLRDMAHSRAEMDRMMQTVLEIADKTFTTSKFGDEYVVSGQTNLMAIDELSNVEKLRYVFEAFNQRRDILHLLDQAVSASGVQIFIGEESGYKVLSDYSVVTATYQTDSKVLGVLGVIGPTRMPYSRVVPIVDLTAKMLSAALKSLS
ncbi:MAG: heat-inducible transcriptional repressor HrcA [Chromatiales bacterium]